MFHENFQVILEETDHALRENSAQQVSPNYLEVDRKELSSTQESPVLDNVPSVHAVQGPFETHFENLDKMEPQNTGTHWGNHQLVEGNVT